MLSLSVQSVPPEACPSPFNMADYVLHAGLSCPNKAALDIIGGPVWSHAELRSAVLNTAGGLQAMGLGEGARVLMRLGNRVEFPIAYLACIWAGLVPVPTSAQLNTVEITTIADDLNPALILVEDGIACPKHMAPTLSLEALVALQGHAPCPPVLGDPERLGYIIYTSGTSGRPRGVCHAQRAIWARRMMWVDWYNLRDSDRVLHAGAFNWSYTLGTGLMDPWSIGATALIMSAAGDSSALCAALGDKNVSIFAAFPGIYRKLLKCPVLQPATNLRHGLSAGEALPDSIRTAWLAHMGCDIHEALGMSECSTFISGAPNLPARLGTTGRAQNGRRIAVLQEGAAVPFGQPGNLAVHRSDPGLMLGYLGDKSERPKWFETGDVVSMEKDGAITYLGRRDDMITAGGYRISPLEIEACFSSIEAIEDCAATQVQISPETSLIALFYASPESLSDADLRAHAQSILAPYKQPRLYIHRSALPKGANGKLNRTALRRSYEATL